MAVSNIEVRNMPEVALYLQFPDRYFRKVIETDRHFIEGRRFLLLFDEVEQAALYTKILQVTEELDHKLDVSRLLPTVVDLEVDSNTSKETGAQWKETLIKYGWEEI